MASASHRPEFQFQAGEFAGQMHGQAAGIPELLPQFVPPGSDALFVDLSFNVAPGEHAALVGVNGAGKSTILRILGGELEPDEGSFSVGGFGTVVTDAIMSGYYLGFLGGSLITPTFVRRVGHVRVFAALASTVSAAFILYAAAPEAWVWTLMRFVVGFSFAGVYVVAESWLNDAATNETRGQALSAYMIVQMSGCGAMSASPFSRFCASGIHAAL